MKAERHEQGKHAEDVSVGGAHDDVGPERGHLDVALTSGRAPLYKWSQTA